LTQSEKSEYSEISCIDIEKATGAASNLIKPKTASITNFKMQRPRDDLMLK